MAIGLLASEQTAGQATDKNNPLLQKYTTPHQVPPFHLIKDAHFKPALQEGIRQHQLEIDAIVNNSKPATFDNTILAMENAGQLLGRVSTVFYNLNSANTNEQIQKIAREIAPALSAHSDNIILNKKLFDRVKTVWNNKNNLKLTPEQQKLLEETYKSFVRSGANLNDADKEKLKKMNGELSLLSLQYGQNILAETNAYQLVIDDKKDLAGLPEGVVAAAADAAKQAGKEGKWVFTLHNPSVMPFLQYADNRELRKKIWEAYSLRGNNNNAHDNKEVLRKIVNLRREKAQLLGYKTHAHYVLEETMAQNPENVNKLLDQLWAPALAVAKQEEQDIQKMVDASGAKFKVAPYDWRYYTEKIRKERFNLDEQELQPYFSLDNIRKGVFTVTEKLYGLQFKPLPNLPKYHQDVTAYEVTEADGKLVGIIYMDFFPRASKRSGAWMTSYRAQKMEKGKRLAPVISIVCNFTKPTGDAPALLTFDEVTTYFHEFGHALHGLLSNVTYESMAGTSVPRDFVELPSQIMENWAAEPEVLKLYGTHYKTGQLISDELIQKMNKAGTFNQGFETTEYLAASLLDLAYHTQTTNLEGDINQFEKTAMAKVGLMEQIIPRYRSTYFSHIFSGGYSAGYYSYIWSGVLDTDAFQVFKENGLFNQEKAQSFRKNILEKGGTEDPMELYKKFRGAEPSIKPLLKKRGLTPVSL
ncbi:M3 family metallopeptidase [Rufibacter sp. XAAS-G3-1]|uniref:M3 family metallopeptidase n=1 Tax=Rufibacter sp. XAAS-G3-1 TaxID=2729134 RepID=UPI001C62A24D|nr:M3 family metallopeptidase [Rufibacter sp. XAAS-G3-1]